MQIFGRSDIDTWPERTTTCCWNDGAEFDGVPVPIPYAYDDVRGTFEVGGTCCGVACVKRYLLGGMGYRHGLQDMWMVTICEIIFKNPALAYVPAAPPRNTLKRYGGHLSLEEYRGGTLNGRVELLSRPMISYPVVAHIQSSENLAGQVTGLRRPTSRHIRDDAVRDAQGAAQGDVVGDARLDTYVAETRSPGTADDGASATEVAAVADVPEESKQPGTSRTRGGLAQFLRRT